MAKGWTLFTIGEIKEDTRSTQQKRHDAKKFSNAIRNTRILKYNELVEQSEKNEAAKTAREDQLIAAYEEKKLKSKALIKETQAIIKKRQKKAKKEATVEVAVVETTPAE